MRSAESRRRRLKSARGGRSTSRTRAARTKVPAARAAAAPPRRRVGKPGAATARVKSKLSALSALEDFDRPLERAQLAVRQALEFRPKCRAARHALGEKVP